MNIQKVACLREIHPGAGAASRLYVADNRDVLGELLEEYRGQVKAVYLDPPFETGKEFHVRVRIGEEAWRGNGKNAVVLPAYSDKKSLDEYLEEMKTVLTAVREMMRDDGLLFLHVDSRLHPYMRVLCDGLFGESNFRNEIIWVYNTGGRSMRYFSKKHDVILMYSKTESYGFYAENVLYVPEGGKTNHMKKHVDPDGRVYRSIRANGKVYTYYDDEPVAPTDVWTDVSHLQQKDPERTGYDTQKPLSLLRRIWGVSTCEGDLTMDLFCGSGTALEAASRMGRRCVGAELNALSANILRRRLRDGNYEIVLPAQTDRIEAVFEVVQGIGDYHILLRSVNVANDHGVEGMDAVDGWSCGYIDNGVYTVCTDSVRNRRMPVPAAELRLPMYSGTPAAAVYDVFGNTSFYTFEDI